MNIKFGRGQREEESANTLPLKSDSRAPSGKTEKYSSNGMVVTSNGVVLSFPKNASSTFWYFDFNLVNHSVQSLSSVSQIEFSH